MHEYALIEAVRFEARTRGDRLAATSVQIVAGSEEFAELNFVLVPAERGAGLYLKGTAKMVGK